MASTAGKLGSAPLTLDWSGLLHGAGKTGADEFEASASWSAVRARFDSGEVGFYHAPVRPELSQWEACQTLAREIRESLRPSDVLFLGIGGSSLGPISLLQALAHRRAEEPRLHFLENPDPIEWKLTLKKLDPARTLVCLVTKSGTTFETLAQGLLALEWLGRERWRTHAIAITDPERGDLRAFATQQGLRTLSIDPSIGGRFSIFSPVGLFPALLAGLDGEQFLRGAQQVRDYCERTPVEKNGLLTLGVELLRHARKRPIHVCMPYSTPLRGLSAWFVQLWGESLGKDGKGFTPLAALGATDQHSILQLMRDGPDDKVTLFITVDETEHPIPVPRTLPGIELSKYPAFERLAGTTLHDLLRIEYQAISLVLSKRERPHLTWKIDRLDERNLGALYFAFSTLTAFVGSCWKINPFDQPGVEEGKIYIQNALKTGRSESQSARAEEEDPNSPYQRLRGRNRDPD
jgi:glucose-6-phosphate isomerase